MGGVTNAVRLLVRPATRWMRVGTMASARVIAGRMVVSRRARIPVTGQTPVHVSSAGRRGRMVWV